ncbi:MAG: hypothetical protein P8X57_15275 [Cyclobacteriaceae bacterium]
MSKFLTVLFLSSIFFSAHAQRHVYRVNWKGDSIGYLIAEQKQRGSLTTYELRSRTKFSLMFSFDMVTEYYSVFRDGQLLSATSENTMNDKRRSFSSIKWLENRYRVMVDEEEHFEDKIIPESIATLYFFPPENESIFSERYGIFCRMERNNTDHYTLIKPDDRKNHYYYENGVCTRIEVNLALATIHMDKIN